VLDDVSPRYQTAGAALQACHVNLGIALRSLLDAGDSDPVPQACRESSGRSVAACDAVMLEPAMIHGRKFSPPLLPRG
jgi:hypothetical protein